MNMNEHTAYQSAFICSTFIDLKGRRHTLAKVLFNAGLNINELTIVILIIFISILITTLIGCAPITTIRKDGSTIKHYVGYVRVIEPPTVGEKEQFNVSELETIGIRIVKGIGVGYFHERNEFIPLDCRLVVRVSNKEQLENVLETLSPIMKEGLCVTVSP